MNDICIPSLSYYIMYKKPRWINNYFDKQLLLNIQAAYVHNAVIYYIYYIVLLLFPFISYIYRQLNTHVRVTNMHGLQFMLGYICVFLSVYFLEYIPGKYQLKHHFQLRRQLQVSLCSSVCPSVLLSVLLSFCLSVTLF